MSSMRDDGETVAEAAEVLENVMGETSDTLDAAVAEEASVWFRVLTALLVVVVLAFAFKILKGESAESRRQRLRNERRAKKKAEKTGPDDVDELLATIVRRGPGGTLPAGSRSISSVAGKGNPRGTSSSAAANGLAQAASRASPGGSKANAAGSGGGAGAARGVPDDRPRLRWDQSNEEVEIFVRVEPDVKRTDVQVEVTRTVLKLTIRGKIVIAGLLYKDVDPDGCTWLIEGNRLGQKEVLITLLKAQPTNRNDYWRAPLKIPDNGRVEAGAGGRAAAAAGASAPSKVPADPDMVRRAIEAIRAKKAVGEQKATPAAVANAVKASKTGLATRSAAAPAPGAAGAAGAAGATGTTTSDAPAPPAVTSTKTSTKSKGGKKGRKKK